MCLSSLGQVVQHDRAGYEAVVDVDGREALVSTVALGLDAPDLSPGDWLVVHTGLAVETLSAEDALRIQAARRDLAANNSIESNQRSDHGAD